jgi:hypothetical protein
MKKHPPSVFPAEVWQQIDFVFWRHELSSLPRGSTGDGVEPHSVECTKRGVEILGRIWFLPKGCYDLHLCLGRPHFSNLSSVTADAVRNLAVTEAWLDQQTLRVTAGIPRKGKGMVDKGMETTTFPADSRVPPRRGDI